MSQATCQIDDFGPLPLVRPASTAELGDLVRRAAAEGQAVYPVGGGTLLGLGQPPTQPGIAIDTRGLDSVIDYPARDMTVTVGAGITLARLRDLLASEEQRLPIDVPLPDQATLGGTLAANVSGPRRHGWGTLRDYLIGISVVGDGGHEARAGGRVVKNVAGYDLCKLHIGALGTLGVITQVTLKLRPRPERDALLTLPCPPGELAGLLDRLHASRTRPVCLDLLNPEAARVVVGEGEWTVVVGYEDNADAVNWQVQQLIRELGCGRPMSAHVAASAAPLWEKLVGFAAWPAARLSFKANLLPSAVAAFCLAASGLGWPVAVQAHAGNGIVLGHAAGELTAEHAAELLGSLRRLAAPGQVVVTRCPAEWKSRLSVWGPPRGDASLMRAVKDNLDPQRLFNPGRFVDGI